MFCIKFCVEDRRVKKFFSLSSNVFTFNPPGLPLYAALNCLEHPKYAPQDPIFTYTIIIQIHSCNNLLP